MAAVLYSPGLLVGLAAGPEESDRLSGFEGTRSPEDMNPSLASQPDRTDEQRGAVSLERLLSNIHTLT